MKAGILPDHDAIPMLVFFVVTIVSIFISWVVLVPLTGALVRFRANYNPKGLQIVEDDEVEQGGVAESPVVGPVVSSYFGMFARIYRLEGSSGLFKGFMPALIFRLLFELSPMGYVRFVHSVFSFRLDEIVLTLFVILFSLPTMTIVYRAMTTTHNLSSFRPRAALQALLSSYERSGYFKLYKAPGLLHTWTLYVILSTRLFGSVTRMFLINVEQALRYLLTNPSDRHQLPGQPDNLAGWIIIFVTLGASALLLTPLQVVLVRLSIQRNNGPASAESAVSEQVGVPDTQVDIAVDEDVITARPDSDPYNGLVDCFKRIVKEEGWTTLYRGWWITLLFGGFHSSFV